MTDMRSRASHGTAAWQASISARRAAPITQPPPVPRSSVHSTFRLVPHLRDTLNDIVKANSDNALPKVNTRAGHEKAAQDRVGFANATQPPRIPLPTKGKTGEQTDQGHDRLNMEDFTLNVQANS
ncbi:unnamed protein product [Phytophthora fragariaefolia]|uniref:Unnamed protein product n=1 Tax=Phytophthora fragariaefolia TaxID=1490495 RepID=A0A9W7D1D1_9STRA|nr:unnamed protein product [Phytophthora fragariaefolia]